MLLWIGCALLTAIVVAALSRPLLRTDSAEVSPREADLAVYKDQLREVEAERDRGLLDAAEAESAKTELARRLLRTADDLEADASLGTPGVKPSPQAKWAVYTSAALIPLLAIAAYLAIGSPGMPDNPHAERLAKSNPDRSVGDLIGMVETRLREHPEDGEGWEVIAPVYMKQQRYLDAAQAYAKSISILGENPRRIAGFAEALVLGNNGLIVPDARKAYQRLAVIEPERPEPKFWLALAKEQDGDLNGAIDDLERMLGAGPTDAPWRKLVEERLTEIRAKTADGSSEKAVVSGNPANATPTAPPSQSTPGPSPDDMAAAQSMSPQQRQAFIEQMVARLAERLEKNGKDLDGWKRLARAYKVMGKDAEAAQAISNARRAFDGDATATQSLDAFAKSLGIGS